ncbi:nucleotidyl transferase AbiEii/AbiGii toxin family protein [Propioniciclava coleopterorum]|uniref:Nucleotidyl transferase AbiEii/AbiGii toxin family protein n=1 Tax=Propioniciclava coleopterorum TaxID=2714937 RepID=A0A6G7Y997_9ACTN|nr:nucleotidyl transferase AbiEii/AbiGii toxin family protein [Propioniciclava coleopterorum]QIK73392.1 nucleotidyl transferase AbiEii/AbiGii toxin family protein [Propioniciclava coleopterorum]
MSPRARRSAARSAYTLDEADAAAQQAHFGVARDQVEHDFVLSHLLAALAPHADRFVFFGGTALSRTHLDGLRLSEDVDLLSVGPRPEAARVLDAAIRDGLERGFGRVEADRDLTAVRRDTDPSVYRIGAVSVRVQLLDGARYPRWPVAPTRVAQRYTGLPDVTLTTYTPDAFVGAKTAAWSDQTRQAARDLYDLWALASRGFITPAAAALYRRLGPTGRAPGPWTFPTRVPGEAEWEASLGHQCRPAVGPRAAHDAVVAAWRAAAGNETDGSDARVDR